MKIIELLVVILIAISMFFVAVHLDKQDKKITILENRIEILEEDSHTLKTKLRAQRLIDCYDSVDADELQTIQRKILEYLKLEYRVEPEKKRLRKWR